MGTVDVVGGIITGGLGRPACEQLIPRAFHLFCFAVDRNPGGGGYYPKPAHNVFHDGKIKDFYQQVDVDQKPVQDDSAYDLAQKFHVTIRVDIKGQQYQREFVVGRHRRNLIVSVVNFINNTRDKVSVVVNSVSVTTKRLTFKIKNMLFRNN